MSLAVCGSADLLRLLAAGGEADFARLARVLGYFPESREDQPPSGELQQASEAIALPNEAAVLEPLVQAQALIQSPFWVVTQVEAVGEDIAQRQREADAGPTLLPAWTTDPGQAPEPTPLAAWRDLLPTLRDRLALPAATRQPDVAAIIRQLGRARHLTQIPRRRRRQWGQTLTVIEDRSDRLIPYWRDQSLIVARLAALFPRHALRHGLIWESMDRPVPADPDEPFECFWPPPAETPVLVLGDLGSLALADDGAVAGRWANLGSALRESGCRGTALLPHAPERCAANVREAWHLLAWERDAGACGLDTLGDSAEQLLAALSLANRIEPGLLRDVRRCLGLPAAVESLAWQHKALSSRSNVAATLRADDAQALRERFWGLSLEPWDDETNPLVARQCAVLKLMHAWRGGLPAEIWFAEIQSLPKELRGLLPRPEDAEAADGFFAALGRRLHGSDMPGLLAWYRFVMPRLRPGHEEDPALGIHFQRLYQKAFAQSLNAPRLPGYDPALAALADASAQPRRYGLAQIADQLVIMPLGRNGDCAEQGSVFGMVETVSGEFKFNLQYEFDAANAFWTDGQPPEWAAAWGWDDKGAWVEFSLDDDEGGRVTQTLRWIPPGQFLMGSPDTEAGRYDDEGPQHPVTISQGFWLFDTPCTQTLWQAVMGDNPSHFKGGDRPVEQVSWDDAQRFIQALNQRLPGLSLSLPSEAQWEYACRAGTTTPFNFGDNITPEQVNYHGKFPYAGGAKGRYRQETVPVGSLPPNDWGLHEMHGNIREWVQDSWHDNYNDAPMEGSVWESTKTGAARVVRGGSWLDVARLCRCAFRSYYSPGVQYGSLGFRCARVQAGGNGQGNRGACKPAGDRPPSQPPPQGEGGLGAVAEGETRLIRLDGTAPAEAALPKARQFQIITDCERLTLRQTVKPKWAKAMGRDRFGLWAQIAVEPELGPPVTQRLRWMPPGRFLMGSPADEPGRFDDEGPQHPVTISQGFWLFDTPCTQALWEAVMDGNPSRFKSPRRPVERVSWNEVQAFLQRLNAKIPGLDLTLPSEAQWEHACRAGTGTALYTGPMDILGERNTSALDDIAWYGGNSGVDFDLPDGYDSSSWTEMQYPNPSAGTREVGQKLPNPWGLYDMLGNVYEWVQDAWHGDYKDAPVDGMVWDSNNTGAARVVRGGAWHSYAQSCRSAFRSPDSPDFRGTSLGFRCARVQL